MEALKSNDALRPCEPGPRSRIVSLLCAKTTPHPEVSLLPSATSTAARSRNNQGSTLSSVSSAPGHNSEAPRHLEPLILFWWERAEPRRKPHATLEASSPPRPA